MRAVRARCGPKAPILPGSAPPLRVGERKGAPAAGLAVAAAPDATAAPEAAGEVDEGKRREARRELVIKIYDLLATTPKDDSGDVEGTPFCVTGVERAMTVLTALSERDSGPSVRISKNVIRFLTDGDSDDKIAGVSLEKLQWLSKMGERFKK